MELPQKKWVMETDLSGLEFSSGARELIVSSTRATQILSKDRIKLDMLE